MKTLSVVQLGVIGSGKTAFFNLITSSNEPEISGGPSVTKQVVVGQAIIGDFEIIDTPGFESESDKLLHAAGVVAALTIRDVNRILIFVKFERDDRMISSIRQVLSPIRRYKDIVTIVVTHFDYSRNQIEDQDRIQKRIKSEFNLDSILFYSKIYSDQVDISLKISNIITQSEFKSIQLQDSEIFSQFDLLQLDDYNQTKLEKNQTAILRQFRKIARIYRQFIEQIDLNDPLVIDILHELTLDIKAVANQHVEEFERLHGEELNEFYDVQGVNIRYLHHIYLKKQIRLDLINVINLSQKTMTKSQIHFYNFIKLCPNCKQPWIKVVGCDGETKCGNRILPFEKDEIIGQASAPKKFEIKIIDNQLRVDIIQNIDDQYSTVNEEANSKFNQLYEYFKNDIHFQKYLGDNFDRQTFLNLMKEKLGKVMDDLYKKINNESKGKVIEQLKIYFYSLFKVENQDYNTNKSIGCGIKFNWSEQPPLSGPELNELLSQDLIDFFNRDQEKLLKDEAYFLEQSYKKLVKDAIDEQKKNKKIIKQQFSYQNEINTQTFKNIQPFVASANKEQQNFTNISQ
ncbi:unnamed protein product [Paramecium pentaurelia]|uniref:G domain-containing protein n=1 Tax=Paramecium pentaurelia TaxID=43138 RepID=A0A8S1VTA8_9CILI|nr:unnamed protein product [Paramecium pentaurelia]